MNSLRIVKLHFDVIVVKDTNLPGFLGNTIRGALGQMLIRSCCSKMHPDCISCDNNTQCVYPMVFKGIHYPSGFDSIPNPFVLEVPTDNKRKYKKGDSWSFQISLFGKATFWTKVIIGTVKKLFSAEFAHTKDCLQLERVSDFFSQEVLFENESFCGEPKAAIWSDQHGQTIEKINEIHVCFLSPTQILRNKVLVKNLDFATFIDNLFFRISSIIDIYEEKEFVLPYGLCYRKPYIVAETDLKTLRISQERHPVDGFVGNIKYVGDLTRYMPYIDLGSILHIGKQTTRGCGQYGFHIF